MLSQPPKQRLGAAVRVRNRADHKNFKFVAGAMGPKNFIHAAANRLAQHLGGGADVLVTGPVTTSVVGQFEVVQIQVDHRQRQS